MRVTLPHLAAAVAILLWASLAASTQSIKHIPPFFQLAVAFGIGGLPILFLGKSAWPSPTSLVFSVAGFYGYHFFLLTAFRIGPALEANLINYLWPVILVLLTPLFFSHVRLSWWHLMGAALAFLGVGVLLSSKSAPTYESWGGYGLALLAAFTWPLYSLFKRTRPDENVAVNAGVCAVSAAFCALTHGLSEAHPVLASREIGWLIWLGIGPFGLAFYLWDYAVKKGDPRVVGALSYATPVFSTILLVALTETELSFGVGSAMGLMLVGSILGSWRSG